MSVYVSIGRNVGNKPMPDNEWRLFRLRTCAAVSMFAGPIISEANGQGKYEGVYEDTYIVVGSRDMSPEENKALTAALSYLSFHFKQECIALTIAEPTFVSPKEPTNAEQRIPSAVNHRARNLSLVD